MCDQFVDRTSGRADTFFDGPIVSHVSSADIYDPELRRIAVEAIREHDIPVHDGGTVVVIQGPRFSTKAESKWFSDAGWEVINMTQYPEAYLCRELGMAVVNISLITDYDAGVHEGTEAVNAMSVLEVFELNAARIQKVVLDMIGRFPADLDALGAGDTLAPTRGDGHAVAPRTSACSRPGSEPPGGPIDRAPARSASASGRSGPTADWWLESARRLDAAGYAGRLGLGPLRRAGATRRCRSSSRGRSCPRPRPTTRIVTVGPFVINVMNRHPAVLARMASTLQIVSGGRLILGIGHRRPTRRAPGARHPVPGGPRAGRPARGGRRGPPRAVDAAGR